MFPAPCSRDCPNAESLAQVLVNDSLLPLLIRASTRSHSLLNLFRSICQLRFRLIAPVLIEIIPPGSGTRQLDSSRSRGSKDRAANALSILGSVWSFFKIYPGRFPLPEKGWVAPARN